MRNEIEGSKIVSEATFHMAISTAMSFPAHYGKNLDALFDVLTSDIERPVVLVWLNSALSKEKMEGGFERIVSVLRNVERQDAEWGLSEKFELQLQ